MQQEHNCSHNYKCFSAFRIEQFTWEEGIVTKPQVYLQ